MDRGRAGVEGGRLLMWGEGGRWCLGRPTPARLLLLLLLRLWRGGAEGEKDEKNGAELQHANINTLMRTNISALLQRTKHFDWFKQVQD